MPQLGIVLRKTESLTTIEFAHRAMALGFDTGWVSELWGENAFAELGAVAATTTDFRVGTGIVNVYSRTPAVLAMGAASLHQLSGGRTALGLGASSRKAIEDLHDQAFEQPANRIEETVQLIKCFFESDKSTVEFEGEQFHVKDFPPLDVEVPVYNSALGPLNRRVTGRTCDGWMPNNIPVGNLSDAFEEVSAGAAEAGRDPDDITVAPWVYVVISENRDEAYNAVRSKIAYYVGNSRGYERALAQVYPDSIGEIASAWRAGKRGKARGLVTDEMVRSLGAAGLADEVHERLGQLIDDPIIDEPILNIPTGLDDDIIETTLAELDPTAL